MRNSIVSNAQQKAVNDSSNNMRAQLNYYYDAQQNKVLQHFPERNLVVIHKQSQRVKELTSNGHVPNPFNYLNVVEKQKARDKSIEQKNFEQA